MADIQQERNQIIQLQQYLDAKDYSAALKLAEQSLRQFPFSFQTKLYYAKILKALGRYTEAVQFLISLDKQFPFNIGILMEMASTYYYMQQFQESLIYYNRILFLDSFNDQAKQRVEEIQRLLDDRFQEKLDETHVDERSANRRKSEMEIARQPTQVLDDEAFGAPVQLQGAAEIKRPDPLSTVESSPPPVPGGTDDIPFITESAAELYEKQGLIDQALYIYRRLFDQTGDPRYQEKWVALGGDSRTDHRQHIVDNLEKLLQRIQAGDR